MPGLLRPSDHQPPLPTERLLLGDLPDPDAIGMDVVVVGAGPAGLATAIRLAQLAHADAAGGGTLGELQIGVLEKAAGLGEHNLSGAVVNPRVFRDLFPDIPTSDLPFRAPVEREAVYYLTETRAHRVPAPPSMRNRGFYTASISEMCRWLGERAEELGVNVLPGSPVESLLVDGDRAVGVRTAPSGLDRNGVPGPRYEPGTDVTARVVVLAEGTRGPLTQAYLRSQGVGSTNPQIYALGVKEVWEVPRAADSVVHTLGWPLTTETFGGSFLYPLAPDLVAIGLVVGLDHPTTAVDVHELLQRLKTHPFFRRRLTGGQMVEWGAKTIPEGGYHSLPERRFGDGVIIVGDAAGFVDVPSLKGIHYAMESGVLAARTIFDALRRGDLRASSLGDYDRSVDDSFIVSDLHRTRNMRLAFRDGFVRGVFASGLSTLTGGSRPADRVGLEPDAAVQRRAETPPPFTPDGVLTFSKVDGVFRSGNQTRDDIPSHLVVGPDVPPEMADLYQRMCPAAVYERGEEGLRVNPPNCIDCKATDVLGPRWMPREAGSGPAYRRM